MPRPNRNERGATRGSNRARRLGAALAAGCLAAAAGAQQTPAGSPAALTLAAALREVAAHSTAAVTATLDVDAARTGTERAEAAYRPSVSVSAGYELRDHEIVAKFGTLSAPTTESSFLTGEIDATQLLWDGGRRAAALASARALEKTAVAQGEAGVLAAQLDGLRAYIRVLVLKAQRRVLAQRIASLQDHLREVNDLFDQGVVARNDVLATEVRLRVVQDQAGQVDDGEAVALQGLNRVLGRNPTEPLALPQALPSPPPLGVSVAELKRRAADGNSRAPRSARPPEGPGGRRRPAPQRQRPDRLRTGLAHLPAEQVPPLPERQRAVPRTLVAALRRRRQEGGGPRGRFRRRADAAGDRRPPAPARGRGRAGLPGIRAGAPPGRHRRDQRQGGPGEPADRGGPVQGRPRQDHRGARRRVAPGRQPLRPRQPALQRLPHAGRCPRRRRGGPRDVLRGRGERRTGAVT